MTTPSNNYMDSRTPEERKQDSAIKETTASTSTPNSKWEDEFLKRFCDESRSTWKYPTDLEDVFEFIRTLLHSRDEELVREVLDLKEKYEPAYESEDKAYVQALSAAIEIIKKRNN